MSPPYLSPRGRERYDRRDRGPTPPSYAHPYLSRRDDRADQWEAYREREREERAEYGRSIARIEGERIRERSPPRKRPITPTRPRNYIQSLPSRQSPSASAPSRLLIFQGFGIHIHFGNMYSEQGINLMNHIRRHAGWPIIDPSDRRVTHIIIDLKPELPLDLVLSVEAKTLSKEDCARRKDWRVKELIKHFARVKGVNRYKTGSINGKTVLIRQEWLRDSIRAGKALGPEEGFGGWEVRGTYDPRLITPITTSSSSYETIHAPPSGHVTVASNRLPPRAYHPRPPPIRWDDKVSSEPPTSLISPTEEVDYHKRQDQVESSISTFETTAGITDYEATTSNIPASDIVESEHDQAFSELELTDDNSNPVVTPELPIPKSEDHSAEEHQTSIEAGRLSVDRYEPQSQKCYNNENEIMDDFTVKEELEEAVKQEMIDMPQALDGPAQWIMGGHPVNSTDRGESLNMADHREQSVEQSPDRAVKEIEMGDDQYSQANISTSVDDRDVPVSRPRVKITLTKTSTLPTEPFATPHSQRNSTSTPISTSGRISITSAASRASRALVASTSGSGSGSTHAIARPPARLSNAKQTGVFIPPLAPPISFHVFESERSEFVELLITETGGGIMTTLDKATYILLPLSKGEYAVDPMHLKVIKRVSEDGWRAVLSENWVKDSILAKKMVDYQEYIIYPHPELEQEQEQGGLIEETAYETMNNDYPPTPSASFSGQEHDQGCIRR